MTIEEQTKYWITSTEQDMPVERVYLRNGILCGVYLPGISSWKKV